MNKNEDMDHIDEMLDEEELKESNNEDEENDIVSKLKNELKEAKDKLLRQVADSENYVKRVQREMDEKIKYANQSMLAKFLPVLDNFDLALQHTEGVAVETVIEGIKLNQKVFLDALEKAGMTKIKAEIGDVFNPEIHEAVALAQNPELPDNCITVVIQNGYKMMDRVVRSAKVQVNKLS